MPKYQMVAVLKENTSFRNVVDAMKDLVKGVYFHCRTDGILLECTDTSNVVLMRMRMNEPYFEEYQCENNFKVGLNMESVGKVMSMCGPNDTLFIDASLGDAEENSKVLFTFEPGDCSERMSTFEMPAIDLTQSEPVEMPEIDYPVMVTMPCAYLKKAVEALKDFGDTVELKIAQEGMTMSVHGDAGIGGYTIKPGDEVKVTVPQDQKSLYMNFSMRYFAFFTKAAPLCDHVSVGMKQGQPVHIKYVIKHETDGLLSYMLAPKVDND